MFLKIFSFSDSSEPFMASISRSPGTCRNSSCMLRSSRSLKLSNTKIRSWIRCPRASSVLVICSMIELSRLGSRQLTMSAAAFAPPKAEVLPAPPLPANCFSMMSSSSLSAEGCMPSSVATLTRTSERTLIGSCPRTSAA